MAKKKNTGKGKRNTGKIKKRKSASNTTLGAKIFKFSVRTLWLSLCAVLLLGTLYFYTVSINLFGLYGSMPSLKALENPENDLSSELISADGVSLGRYFRYNRSQVSYEELSPALIHTLISSEDHRFMHHAGVDMIGLMRAVKGKLTGSFAGGGSTLTMQLAENLFDTMTEHDGFLYRFSSLWPLIVKSKEWIIAVQLEKNFTKREIIALYLNTVAFGSNTYGIKTAAETFFGKKTADINYQEAAVLVGILQGITRFNPKRHPDNALLKRNQVLGKVAKRGHISMAERDSLRAMPIDLSRFKAAYQDDGLAPYFYDIVKKEMKLWCKDHGYDLFEDGLKIYTTIDSRMQRHAEAAVSEQMRRVQGRFDIKGNASIPWLDSRGERKKEVLLALFKKTERYQQLLENHRSDSEGLAQLLRQKNKVTVFTYRGEVDTLMTPLDSLDYFRRFLHTGFMAMDPHTGYVKAWVGGIAHRYFAYDHVLQGKRQAGSTFKPFVYGAALENGYYPCYTLDDISPKLKLSSGKYWQPKNSGGGYGTGETMTLRQGMARSVNSITAQLMSKIKVENVIKFAHQVGIQSELDAVPSLCLGTSSLSLYELVGAYSTFVNQGVHTLPYYIMRIEDKYGNVIENRIPQTRQALTERDAYLMVHLLKGGVEEKGGTSVGLSQAVKSGNEVGGKTGTTDDASDAWYVGITKDLVAGVWVGGEVSAIRFKKWSEGQGGKTARPIWDSFMQKVYLDERLGIRKGAFQRPALPLGVSLDCDEYHLSGPGTEGEDPVF